MKKVIFPIIGAIFGGALCNLIFYLIGKIAVAADFRLFNSEEEASRNFVVFLVVLVVFILLGGIKGYFISKKQKNVIR